MAKAEYNGKKGVWRTIQGRKVFIADGQTLNSAMAESGKFKKVDFSKKPAKSKELSPKEKWQNKAQEYETAKELADKHGSELVDDGVIDLDKDIDKQLRELFFDKKYEDKPDFKEMKREQVADIITSKIPPEVRDGWFRAENGRDRDRIEMLALKDKELWNAGMNAAHEIYQRQTGQKIGFEEFLDTEITVYRGGHFNLEDETRNVLSYSFDKGIAESFKSDFTGHSLHEVKIKPKDTIGSYTVTPEAEIFVRLDKVKDKGKWKN